MGACSSKKPKAKNNTSTHLNGDVDDEVRQKNRQLDQFNALITNGDNLFLAQDLKPAIEQYKKAHEQMQEIEMKYEQCTYALSSLYQRLSFAYRLDKQYEESLEWDKKAFELRRERITKNDELIAGGYASLAIAHQAVGNSDIAMRFCEKALGLRIELFGESGWVVALSYEWMAMARTMEGKYEEAVEYLNKAKKNLVGEFGENSLYVGYNYSTFGRIYQLQGKMEEAVKAYKESVKILETAKPLYCDLLAETGRNYTHGEIMRALSEHPQGVKYGKVKVLQKMAECLRILKRTGEAKETLDKSVIVAAQISSIAEEKAKAKAKKIETKY